MPESKKHFVARAKSPYQEYSVGLIASAVYSFNQITLPVLRELRAFHSHNIDDYRSIDYNFLYSGYLASRLSDAKNEAEAEHIRMTAREEFAEYTSKKLVHLPASFASPGNAEYISYDGKLGIFVFDEEKYRGATDIFAESAEEKETLKRLETLIAALAKLHISNLRQLGSLVHFDGGKPAIVPEMDPAVWRALVHTVIDNG